MLTGNIVTSLSAHNKLIAVDIVVVVELECHRTTFYLDINIGHMQQSIDDGWKIYFWRPSQPFQTISMCLG